MIKQHTVLGVGHDRERQVKVNVQLRRLKLKIRVFILKVDCVHDATFVTCPAQRTFAARLRFELTVYSHFIADAAVLTIIGGATDRLLYLLYCLLLIADKRQSDRIHQVTELTRESVLAFACIILNAVNARAKLTLVVDTVICVYVAVVAVIAPAAFTSVAGAVGDSNAFGIVLTRIGRGIQSAPFYFIFTIKTVITFSAFTFVVTQAIYASGIVLTIVLLTFVDVRFTMVASPALFAFTSLL